MVLQFLYLYWSVLIKIYNFITTSAPKLSHTFPPFYIHHTFIYIFTQYTWWDNNTNVIYGSVSDVSITNIFRFIVLAELESFILLNLYLGLSVGRELTIIGSSLSTAGQPNQNFDDCSGFSLITRICISLNFQKPVPLKKYVEPERK